jgi:rRNA maturation endonuclease Nob1
LTMTERLQQQKRFFCENCKRELFLDSKFCDGCGGQIQWPAEVQKILSSWTKKKSRSPIALNKFW